ncbi:hypothetical protein DLM45_03330 [Hyphomicrobium methylovorum]|uniref:hypothetical protein n=1 Tax=Hyphomicrobium methylovorum TaxID=84 RepID=UPI0015E6A285|nr:hypothetical protein [Hyphomicrobium methylovorum]MBA2125255.1 hypothetical protein [Hyphomicrobium methylovorum]
MTFCRDLGSGRTKLRVFTVCTIATLLTTSVAAAATISNRGDKEIKLTITEGSSRKDEVLPPGKVIDGVCRKGCIIRLNDSSKDEYELEGSESVSVEEGFLYYDQPDNRVAPRPGSGSGTGDQK